jgi:hypothetical protein
LFWGRILNRFGNLLPLQMSRDSTAMLGQFGSVFSFLMEWFHFEYPERSVCI